MKFVKNLMLCAALAVGLVSAALGLRKSLVKLAIVATTHHFHIKIHRASLWVLKLIF